MEDLDAGLMAELKKLDSYWNPLDAPASEANFRRLLPTAEQVAAKDPSYLIELISWMARAQALQKNLADSRTSLERAEKLLSERTATYPAATRIRWLLEKSRLHILEKTPSQARALLEEAWNLAIEFKEDFFAVEVAQMMAAIEPQKAQQEWLSRAIEISEKSSSEKTKRWLGTLYPTWAWKLYDVRQFEKSLQVFRKALAHLKTHGTSREVFVAQWSIGKVLRALGKTEEALLIQKELLTELGTEGTRDGRLFEELAECLQTLNRSVEAQPYFELAYRELSGDEWITDNQPLKLKRMKDLGKVK